MEGSATFNINYQIRKVKKPVWVVHPLTLSPTGHNDSERVALVTDVVSIVLSEPGIRPGAPSGRVSVFWLRSEHGNLRPSIHVTGTDLALLFHFPEILAPLRAMSGGGLLSIQHYVELLSLHGIDRAESVEPIERCTFECDACALTYALNERVPEEEAGSANICANCFDDEVLFNRRPLDPVQRSVATPGPANIQVQPVYPSPSGRGWKTRH